VLRSIQDSSQKKKISLSEFNPVWQSKTNSSNARSQQVIALVGMGWLTGQKEQAAQPCATSRAFRVQ